MGYITARNPNCSGLDAVPVQDCCLWLVLQKSDDCDGFYISQRNKRHRQGNKDFLQHIHTQFYTVNFILSILKYYKYT